MPTRSVETSIRMTPQGKAELEELAAHMRISQAAVIETAVRKLYQEEMRTMKAATKIVRIDSKNERIELRSGAKGTGKVLWACNYWPDSYRSVEEMERLLSEYVSQNDIELIGETP